MSHAQASESIQEVAETREKLRRFVDDARFRYSILVLIVVNAAVLGLQTSSEAMAAMGETLILADQIILGVFVVEIALRVYAHGLGFFRDGWGPFDLAVVAVALVPASDAFSVLRAMRVLRVLRLVSAVPSLRRVVRALLHAVPGVGAVSALLVILAYVFAVISTNLFGESFPEWFGSIGASMFTLFQIMTLEGWAMEMARPIMDVYPYAWLFFVIFIVASSFTVLNLFLAIMVDSMQTLRKIEHEETVEDVSEIVHEDTQALAAEIAGLRAEVGALRAALQERRG